MTPSQVVKEQTRELIVMIGAGHSVKQMVSFRFWKMINMVTVKKDCDMKLEKGRQVPDLVPGINGENLC